MGSPDPTSWLKAHLNTQEELVLVMVLVSTSLGIETGRYQYWYQCMHMQVAIPVSQTMSGSILLLA